MRHPLALPAEPDTEPAARPPVQPAADCAAEVAQPIAPGLPEGLVPSALLAQLPDIVVPVRPTPVPEPRWVARCDALAGEMGLDPDRLAEPQTLQLLAGNTLPAHGQPVASVYAGHQFGHWAGQLGDGRAILLGDWHGPSGRWEVQLKGAGLTPFSRMGDGRAVLRSSIREFLASEAMHGLGIPTTRALALVSSPLPVARERWESAAILTRVAPSFLRFGHIEHLSYSGQHAALRALADWLIAHHHPHCADPSHPAHRGGATQPYLALLHHISLTTAELLAQWQAVGFCHGVMNTDNMSLLGLTIDYGPFQFMDGFDPGHICNHSDHSGRYAYSRQPAIARWNLFALAQAMLPLLGQGEDAAHAAAQALEPYPHHFAQALDRCTAAKLGLLPPAAAGSGQPPVSHPPDLGPTLALARRLSGPLLSHMAHQRVDHTLQWRRLSDWVHASQPLPLSAHPTGQRLAALWADPEPLAAWLIIYQEQTAHIPLALKADRMLKANPKYTLRNHLAQTAISRAEEGDFRMVAELLTVLQRPFDEHPAFEAWAEPPPDWAAHITISCSS